MTTLAHDSDAVAQAEALVAQVEDEARQLARSLLARTVEIVEDIWAEAVSARDDMLR